MVLFPRVDSVSGSALARRAPTEVSQLHIPKARYQNDSGLHFCSELFGQLPYALNTSSMMQLQERKDRRLPARACLRVSAESVNS